MDRLMDSAPIPAYLGSVHHDGSPRYVHSPAGDDPRLGDEVLLRLRAAPTAPIERVLLRLCPDGEQAFFELQPEPVAPGDACRWWQARWRLSMPLTLYRFLLFTPDGAWWLNAGGLQRHTPTDSEDFRLLAGYQPAEWARLSVFYQIFPDRFYDGDPDNNVRSGEYTYRGAPARASPWGRPPLANWPQSMVEFFGGDLVGIEQKLAYIADLGANALYLNPIFTAYSNHRYDVIDYFQVDPHLGGDQALISLRQAAERAGIRLILDIVPNHCGVQHPWFQAALNDPAAPTAEYFTFHQHPADYEAWLGVPSLPKFNYRSQALRDAMYGADDSVFRYWLRPPYRIDGWRLDVANMLARQGAFQLGREVGSQIRQAVKAANPSAYLLGENFFDASSQLQGDLWDASMNYSGFYRPLLHWLIGFRVRQDGQAYYTDTSGPWPTRALLDTWQAHRATIPWAIARQQFNLLGSHDTRRILALLEGNKDLLRLAVGILMTYPGAPCVYYGDEIGLAGDERACMPWDEAEWDQDLRGYFRALIHLRRASPALISGGFQELYAGQETFAYLRDAEAEQIIVAAQRKPEQSYLQVSAARAALSEGGRFREMFSGESAVVENGSLRLPLPPVGVSLWRSLPTP
jgi:alpha-glucosidase